ncbi:MAG TPA: dTDP-4-dehydrorhamnose 3,5-epimerase [Candidatus Dormibacteraeota bacterium]|nr:dTDP-4-dehydrorhamnose 3,5-epimerase [Candidatus Dormibacteraeota bacterium]
MSFRPVPLKGAALVEMHPFEDERGFFARAWCAEEFEAAGLNPALVQINLSHNRLRGTLRGMHFQSEPHAEAKLVRCTRGAIFDVMVDMRPDSATYLAWFGVELTAENGLSAYLPEGFAHGFQSLVDDSDLVYHVSHAHHPESEGGLRWNDPKLGIQWPISNPILSPRDRNHPLLG